MSSSDLIQSTSVRQLQTRLPRRSCLLRAVVGLVLSCSAAMAFGQSPILLRDVTAHTGITFRHNDGGNGQRYIMEFVSTDWLCLTMTGMDGRIFISSTALRCGAQRSRSRSAMPCSATKARGGLRTSRNRPESATRDTVWGLQPPTTITMVTRIFMSTTSARMSSTATMAMGHSATSPSWPA